MSNGFQNWNPIWPESEAEHRGTAADNAGDAITIEANRRGYTTTWVPCCAKHTDWALWQISRYGDPASKAATARDLQSNQRISLDVERRMTQMGNGHHGNGFHGYRDPTGNEATAAADRGARRFR